MDLIKFTNFGQESVDISNQLIDTLNKYKIDSVSAPEIGINYTIFAVRSYPGEPVFVAFNPKLVYKSEDSLATAHEKCFSYPGLQVKITRPYSIRVRFQDPAGVVTTKAFDGAIARLFQHEFCHMENRVFWDDANFINRSKAIKDWKQIQRRLYKNKQELENA